MPANLTIAADYARDFNLASLQQLKQSARQAYQERKVVSHSVLGMSLTFQPETAENDYLTLIEAIRIRQEADAAAAAEEDYSPDQTAQALSHHFDLSPRRLY